MNLLKLRTIRKISLVDKGAAIGAKVAYLKHLKESTMNLKDKIAQYVTKAITDALQPITDPPETPHEQLRIALAGIDVAKQAALYPKILEAVSKQGGDPQALLEAALADLPDDKRAAIMAAVAALHQAMPPPAEPPKPAVEPKADEPPIPEEEEEKLMAKRMEEVVKALSPEMQKAVAPLLAYTKQQDAKLEGLTKRLGSTEDKLAGEVAEKRLSAEVEVAKRFPFVPGDVTERAATLLAIRTGAGEEAYKKMVDSFDAANKLAKSGMSAPGTARISDEGDDDSAHAQMCRKARDLVEKSDKPLTFELAYARVAKQNKELYKKAALEQRAAYH